MDRQISAIKKQLHTELLGSSSAYLKLGLELFHKGRKDTSYTTYTTQTSIGNLSTAIELMIKAFLAAQNPTLIFRDLPLELKILFSAADPVPTIANWRHHFLELRSYAYRTIELGETIAAFGIYCSTEHLHLRSYFRLLSNIRNKSLHAALTSFQQYDLERIAYLALKVLEALSPRMPKGAYWYLLRKEDKEFLSIFNENRIQRVHKKIEGARQKAKEITSTHSPASVSGWELYITTCPICQSDGVLFGNTELHTEQTGPDNYEQDLTFVADSFECQECGLQLDDFEEVRLAGMETVYDRSDELDSWPQDGGGWS